MHDSAKLGIILFNYFLGCGLAFDLFFYFSRLVMHYRDETHVIRPTHRETSDVKLLKKCECKLF